MSAGAPNYELAELDYIAGMKYKDIAEKYSVSLNTVKSWKVRYKWSKDNKKGVHTKKEKVCTQERVQPVIENDHLTEQQKLFCLYYLQSFNATKAYQQAYQCTYKTANAHGYRMLSNVVIKGELHRLKEELQQDIFIDTKDIVQEYAKQFGSDITDVVKVELSEYQLTNEAGEVFDKDGNPIMVKYNNIYLEPSDNFDGKLVKKISQGRDGISVELYDKHKAMTELMKYMGGQGGTNTNITIIDEWSGEDEQ